MLKRFLDLFKSKPKPEPVKQYCFYGVNNKLLVWSNDINDYVETIEEINGLTLEIHGNNNIIKIDDPSIIRDLRLVVFSNNFNFHLGKDNHTPYGSRVLGLHVFISSENANLDIGDDVSINCNVDIFCGEPNCRCKIGNGVRIAGDVRIFATDGHPVVDLKQNKIINYGNGKRCLTIGNNCWLGMGCFIGKNGNLPDYTIVAARSVVTKPFNENNIIVAGCPAKIVKRNVRRVDTWKEAFDKYSY